MATEVYKSDLNTIQDEDVLRRMWVDTEDFGRKKEIRARMYKLREQRLKDFYKTGDVSEINRKHQRTTHAESLEDQGFMTMKSKEIRDSESPTRDISQRKGNGYWDTRQETVYGRGKVEDKDVEIKYVELEGRGVVKEGDTETKMAYTTHSSQESGWKEDENSSIKSEAQSKVSQAASVSKSDNAEERTISQSKEFSTKSEQKSQNSTSTSFSQSSSTTSSSKKVFSNSYQVTSGDNQIDYVDDGRPAIQYEDTSKDFQDDLRNYSNQTQNFSNSRTEKRMVSSHTRDDSKSEIHDSNINYARDDTTNEFENTRNAQNITKTETEIRNEDTYKNTRDSDYTTVRKDAKEETRNLINKEISTEVSNQRDVDTTNVVKEETVIKNGSEKATEQKILNEIHKLDTYLSTHTPIPSTPVSPREPDGGWTLVSDKNGEFVYHEKNTDLKIPQDKKTSSTTSLDMPTSATDGQYMTTYQQSYNKISVDHSPAHEFFAKTLRSSPDRSTPSPTKSVQSSSNRSSPERRKMSNSKTSLERSSPEHKRKPDSKRSSPSKSPVQKRKPSTDNVTERKTSDRTTVKETKSKRKFSSTKEKAANRNRVATPGASPTTSPVHKKQSKDTSDSDSDASQATYNKSTYVTKTSETKVNIQKKKERSPEYSSEGSITKELQKKKESSPERSAFAPIKKFKTSPEKDTTDELTVENVRQHTTISEERRTTETDNLMNFHKEETEVKQTEDVLDVNVEDDEKTVHVSTPVVSTTRIEETREVTRSNTSSPTKPLKVDKSKSGTISTETFVIEEKCQNVSQNIQGRRAPKQEPEIPFSKKKTYQSPSSSPERKQPERSPSPIKKPSVPKTERRSSTENTTTTKTTSRQESITKRTTTKLNEPKQAEKPRTTPAKKPVATTERKPTVQKTIRQTTTTRTEQYSSPKRYESPVKKTETTTTVRKVQSRSNTQERKVPSSPTKPKTAPSYQTPVKKEVTSPSSRLTKTTVSTSARQTANRITKKEDGPLRRRPSSEDNKPDAAKTKPASSTPIRSVPQKPKTPETPRSRPAQKPTEKTYNASPVQRKPATVYSRPKEIEKTTVTTRDTRKRETKTFLNNELKNVSDLEDEAPPDEFYADMDDDIDSTDQRKTSKITTVTQKTTKHVTSRNSSVLSLEDEAPAKPKPQQYKRDTLKTDSNQDFLNVIVQHPKSSRESSPGYPSTADNFIVTTSEDGESNPRYADFVSEPEDVEVFDKLIGPSGPIEYGKPKIDEENSDENEISKSVAEKVSVFLNEARKSLETRTTTNQVLIDSSNSVSQAKTLFENASKLENNKNTTDTLEILKTPLFRDQDKIYKPKEEVPETKKIEDGINFSSKKPKAVDEPDNKQLKDTSKTPRKDTPVPKPPGKTFVREDEKKTITEKESISTNIDVSTKKSFFEKKAQEQTSPKTKPETGSYMKSTIASNVRARSPDKIFNEERRKSSLVSEQEIPTLERKQSKTEVKTKTETTKIERKVSSDKSFPRRSSQPERSPSPPKSAKTPDRATSPPKYLETKKRASSPPKYFEARKDKIERPSSPPKQYEPKKTEKEQRPRSPEKTKPSELTPRRSSKPDSEAKPLTKPVNISTESTLFKKTESTKTEEKFGVQLRKTPSATKFELTQARKSLTGEIPEIESIFDLELLEQLLIKAEAYEERRRIRAQIRLVKKELEEKHNNTAKTTRTQVRTSHVFTTSTNKEAEKPKTRNYKEVSPEPLTKKSSVTKTTYTTEERTSRKSSPERLKSTFLPEKNVTSVLKSTTTTSQEKTNLKRASPERTTKILPSEVKSKQVETSFLTRRKSSTDSTTDKTSGVKKTTSTFERKTTTTTTSSDKKTSGTELITSSYGVGPTDENGRPLFGLRALRKSNVEPTPSGDSVSTDFKQAETVSTYTTQTFRTTELSAPASLASLKTISQIGRQYSGPEIVEVTNDPIYENTRKRSSKDYTVEEVTDSREKRLSSELKEDNVKAFTTHMKLREDFQKSNEETNMEAKKPFVRGDSVKALQHKFQQATEAANQPSGGSSYPKAGLILRSNSLLQSDDPNQLSSSMKRTKVERVETSRRVVHDSFGDNGGEEQVVVKAQMSEKVEDSNGLKSAREVQGVRAVQTTHTRDGPVEKSAAAMRVTTSSGGTTSTTSFLDNNAKVTGVQDILARMRNADLVTESGDTEEDAQARALLNKFLGASVILQGMEQGMKHSNQQRSAALVGEADKQLVKATIRNREENIEDICDEAQLKNLLESCTDLEDRRKLRARLREVMAEDKGGVGEPNGSLGGFELSGIWPKGANVDDSGTESGEDLRLINPQVMQEVQTALSRLEGVIPGLDPTKRNAVTQLVSSLQSCLKINKEQSIVPPTPPPRKFGNKRLLKNRHTVGVTREELVEARKWADECGLNRKTSAGDIHSSSIVSNVFRPVRFIPPPKVEETPKYTQHHLLQIAYQKPVLHKIGFFMEPGPQNGVISYEQETPSYERSLSDTGSLSDYDPSLNLFTPEQSVQIAVHKAAINKQINRNVKVQRGSSEDGDVSSADEDKELSSVQRLLQLASEANKKPKFAGSKKQKMKRANTIDIPKPSHIFDYSSDDYGASADECNRKGSDDMGQLGNARPPSFEPKTENDHKFLSFLKRVSESEGAKVPSYNPSARGGKHWQNRFSTIKTAFEPKDLTPKHTFSPSPAKLFWQKSESQNLKETKTQGKLPWSVKTQEDGVIVGSLIVAKPIVNNFNHASKSAFKPIEKKPTTPLISPASGSVKQIAALKFSAAENPVQKPKPKTPIFKPVSIENDKNKFQMYNHNTNVTQKFYNIPSNVVSHDVKHKVLEKPVNNILEPNKPKYKSIIENNKPEKKYNYGSLKNFEPNQPTYLPSYKPIYQPLSQKFNQTYNNSINNEINHPKRKSEHFLDDYKKDQTLNQPINKISNAYLNNVDETNRVKQIVREPKIEPEMVDISRNFNSRGNYTAEEKSHQKYISPYSNKEQVLKQYNNLMKDEKPMSNEDKYLCNLRDASTIDTQSEYVSNIPATRTVLRDGQYVSITPKSRTPTDVEIHDYNKQSPNLSGGSTNQLSPTDSSMNGHVLYNNTMRFPTNRMEDTSHIENYLNVRLSNPYSLSPHNLPTCERTSPGPGRNSVPLSPSIKVDEVEVTPNGDFYEEKAVSRVMGQAQCQNAVVVNNRKKTRYDDVKNIQSELRLQVQQSAKQKSLSPTNFPNVLQKSESWHQMVKEKMTKAKQAPPLPKITKAKSSHSLALPRQFESSLAPEQVESKKMTVSQYLSKQQNHREKRKSLHIASKSMLDLDDLDNVDEVFESIFQEASKKRNSK